MAHTSTRHQSNRLASSLNHPSAGYPLLRVLLLGVNLAIIPVSAEANIFEPILKVLLPFYDGQTTDQSTQATEQNQSDSTTTFNPTRQPASASQPQDQHHKANVAFGKQEPVDGESRIDSELAVSSEQSANNLNDANNTNDAVILATQQPASNPAVQLLIDGEGHAIPTPIRPEPSLYALLTAEFASDRGDIDTALFTYKRQAFGKNATAVFERALTLSIEYEQPAESLIFASEWYRQNPEHVPSWFYVAHLALQAHDYQLAGKTLSQILTYDPKADLSKILEGIYPEEDADQRELLTTLQQLNSEENSALSVLQAGLLLQQQQPQIALVYVDRALKIEPNTVPYITLKADILKQIKESKKVLSFLRKARKRLPEAKKLYLYEVRYLLARSKSSKTAESDAENNKQVLPLLLEASERFPEDPEITLLTALVSLDSEEYQIGDRFLTELLDRPAFIDQANYYLGISAERQHRYQDAKHYFSQVMQEDLVLKARQKVVAYALLNNDSEEAIRTLVELRQNFDIYASESYILQADILEKQGNLSTAKQLLTEARKAFPEDVALEFAYAKLLDDKVNYKEKYRLLAHLRQDDPDNLDYQLQLAKLLLKHNHNSAQGKQLAKAVVATPYNDPRFDHQRYMQGLNILAMVDLEQQNYHQVVDALQIPFEVLPNLETGKLLLQAYQALGNINQTALLQAELTQRFDYPAMVTPIDGDNTINDNPDHQHSDDDKSLFIHPQQTSTHNTTNQPISNYPQFLPVSTTQDFQPTQPSSHQANK